MTEDIKNLIEKIQEEGVKVAEDKARGIEEQARRQAQGIIKKANSEAERIIVQAQDRVAKMEESANASLKQVGRDLLLSLKKEINEMLDRIIRLHVHESLNIDELIKIISTLIKENKGREDIMISLNKDDFQKLEKGIFNELREEIKKGVTLKPSEDILGGFIISYDAGKSHFDFTDKALAEYIGSYLRPKLAELLKE
jgi:V/A-type H+-transporting ATPase subunit E